MLCILIHLVCWRFNVALLWLNLKEFHFRMLILWQNAIIHTTHMDIIQFWFCFIISLWLSLMMGIKVFFNSVLLLHAHGWYVLPWPHWFAALNLATHEAVSLFLRTDPFSSYRCSIYIMHLSRCSCIYTAMMQMNQPPVKEKVPGILCNWI